VERLRSQFESERKIAPGLETPQTNANSYEVRCGMCGKISYVDEVTFRSIKAATDAGFDCPFSCNRCQDEYDELAYEG
jgi:hypothetical protein